LALGDAADRNLFQAPFRAGIRVDPYQLLPLAKALRLPRVNLMIADACTLALLPIRDTHSDGFSYFATSTVAPVASGWSGCRVGLAPTGKRRLVTAHAISGQSAFVTSGASNGSSCRAVLQYKPKSTLYGGMPAAILMLIQARSGDPA
jgi:hypothetical protein